MERSISLHKALSLDNNESFELMLSLIAMEFESKKDILQKIKSEREFLKSNELGKLINVIKNRTVCWMARPECLSWLDDYITTVLLKHWRALSKESIQKDANISDKISEKSSPILHKSDVAVIADGLRSNPPLSVTSVPISGSSLSSCSRVASTLQQVNLRIICTNADNGRKLIEPDFELAAASCLVNFPVTRLGQNYSYYYYSWQVFIEKLQQLLDDKMQKDASQISQDSIEYWHPDNEMRAIGNQEQFSVALNHLFCSIQGCTATLYYRNSVSGRRGLRSSEGIDNKIPPNQRSASVLESTSTQVNTDTSEWENASTGEKGSSPSSSQSRIPVAKKETLKRSSNVKVRRLAGKDSLESSKRMISIPRYAVGARGQLVEVRGTHSSSHKLSRISTQKKNKPPSFSYLRIQKSKREKFCQKPNCSCL